MGAGGETERYNRAYKRQYQSRNTESCARHPLHAVIVSNVQTLPQANRQICGYHYASRARTGTASKSYCSVDGSSDPRAAMTSAPATTLA